MNENFGISSSNPVSFAKLDVSSVKGLCSLSIRTASFHFVTSFFVQVALADL
jgi:hypothetical protein